MVWTDVSSILRLSQTCFESETEKSTPFAISDMQKYNPDNYYTCKNRSLNNKKVTLYQICE